MKRAIALSCLLVLGACGGGGGSAGTSSFGNGSGGGTDAGGSSAPGGILGSPNGGVPTPPTSGSPEGGGLSNVATGRPNQRSMSLSVENYALDWSIDGAQTTVNVRVTDTAGNPVPDGTAVQFSTEGGQIQTSCKLTGVKEGGSTISKCSVTFETQNRRPLDGYVAIVAWLEGDEAYFDLNGNGKYDAGEPFFDTGRIFRDDDESANYSKDIDELNLGETVLSSPGLGTQSCGPNSGGSNLVVTPETFSFRSTTVPLSVDGTCDGQWGSTLVRAQVYLPISDPRFLGIRPAPGGVEVFSQWASDPARAAAAPSGTTVSVIATPAGCSLLVSPSTVPVTAVLPTLHRLSPSVSGTCASGTATVKATFDTYEAIVDVPLPP